MICTGLDTLILKYTAILSLRYRLLLLYKKSGLLHAQLNS
jgi:hypothetical protein